MRDNADTPSSHVALAMRGAAHRLALLPLALAAQQARAEAMAPPKTPPSASLPSPNLGGSVAPGAAHRVILRVATHGAAGRALFKVGKGQADSEERRGDALYVHLPGAFVVAGAPLGTTNILSVSGGPGGAVLNLAAGSVTRVWHQGGLLGIDVSTAIPAVTAARPVASGSTPSGSAKPAELLTDQRAAWAAGAAKAIETTPPVPPVSVGGPGAQALPPRSRAAAPDRAPLQIELVPIGQAPNLPAPA